MERRAASHTEEEEMNQRRRLLNAAKKGDQKAVAKLFELYQVRVYNNDMVSKLNRAASTHKLQAKLAQNKLAQGKQSRGSTAKHASTKPGRVPVQASHAVKNKNGDDRKNAPKKHKK